MIVNKPSCSIVGANGYIGKHLSTHLVSLGWIVYNYDLQKNSDCFPYKTIDITDTSSIKSIHLDVDYLFFFSGLTGTSVGFDSYERFVKVNEVGLLNILDYIRQSVFLPKVVFSSTRLVYKGSENPLKETDEKLPLSIYAINKLSCENILALYQTVFDIPYTIFRICVPYGNIFANYSYGTIGCFLKQARNNAPINLYGQGELKRTFTHISDICTQISDCITKDNSNNQIFNIGGEAFSLKEVAEIIVGKYGNNITYSSWSDMDKKIESGSTVFDDSKIKSVIGSYTYYAFSSLKWIDNE